MPFCSTSLDLRAIERDLEFSRFSRQASAAMLCRRRTVFDAIQHLLRAFHTGSPYALAVRGSYARGMPGRFSDLDLILIGNKDCCEYVNKLCELCGLVCEVDQSIWWCPPAFMHPSSASFPLWLCIPSLVFLGGNRRLFNEFRRSSHDALKLQPLSRLYEMHREDPLRHRSQFFSSDPRYDLKRGRGGSVDYEFTQLVDLWTRLHGLTATIPQIKNLGLVRRYQRYLAFYREFLDSRITALVDGAEDCRSVAITPSRPFPTSVWFFTEEAAHSAMNSQYAGIAELLETMRGFL